MIIDSLLHFTTFLQDNGYSISENKIQQFFSFFANQKELSYTSESDVLCVMEMMFCSTPKEVDSLRTLFHIFIKKYKDLVKEKEDFKSQTEKIKQKETELDQKLQKISDKNDAKLQKLKENKERLKSSVQNISVLSNKDWNFLKKNKDMLKKISFQEDSMNQLMKELLNHTEDHLAAVSINFDTNFIEDMKKALTKEAEKRVMNGDFSLLQQMNALMGILKRLSKNLEKISVNKIEQDIESQNNWFWRQKETIEKQKNAQKNEMQKIQDELSRIMKEEQQGRVVCKDYSVFHRKEFTNGKNAVYSDNVLDYMIKEFENLTKSDQIEIERYLKKNLTKFRTKMNRRIQSTSRHEIDIQTTIQNACKTGGLPMQICYKEKKKNRPNLVMILDVSGSCKAASSMMLTFMYTLQELFPGGCHAYAFVNSLYDISDIMKASKIEDAIDNVLNAIPRRGVYSNYYAPLETLWKEKHNVITSDSIVFFMGDARNNENKSGIEFLKNIARRAESCFWLNTDRLEKWGTGDSIAYLYSEYAKMYEVRNIAELAGFIENF